MTRISLGDRDGETLLSSLMRTDPRRDAFLHSLNTCLVVTAVQAICCVLYKINTGHAPWSMPRRMWRLTAAVPPALMG